jgi:hypothetical protein
MPIDFVLGLHGLHTVGNQHQSCDRLTEIPQVNPKLVPNPAEDGHALGIGADTLRWRIFETVVQSLCIAEENGTGLACMVTDRNDVIEVLPVKLGDILRAVTRNVDAQFFHGGDCFGANETGFRARALDFEPVAGIVPQKTFRHLAPR